MSQVPVKWVYEGDLWDDADEEEYRTVPVVPLSALRGEIVEKINPQDGKSLEYIEGYFGALRDLLASLGEVKDVPEIGFGNRKEMGHE